ncbi:MAG: insulinase family protein [Deltaproteobacteria bacterium]|nr:insulinase family protein [Deltaproteobacteria bacterium]
MTQRTMLDNGIRVLSEDVPGCHSVSLGVWVNNGSRHEPVALNGISHFVEHMLFKGTDRRTAQSVAREVDSVGGLLNGFTSREFSCYFVKILAEKLPMAVDLLGDMICHSRFSPDDIEKERRVILQEIAMIEDSPEDLIHDQFTHAFWAGHTLGMPVIGTQDTVGDVDRQQLLEFMEARYVGQNLCVVAAGCVDHEQLVRLVEASFGDRPVSGVKQEDITPVVGRKVEVTRRELEQAQVCLGVEGLPQNHPDRYATYLLNTILGGNMSSRLFQKVREELGLAYSVYSYHHNHSDSGAFIIYAGVAAEEAPLVTRTILDEMTRMRHAMVTPDELQSAKDFLKGSMLLSMESTDNRMTRLAKNELFLRDLGTSLEKSRDMIDAVTAESVQSLAARLFVNQTLNIQVAGRVDPADFPDSDMLLG